MQKPESIDTSPVERTLFGWTPDSMLLPVGFSYRTENPYYVGMTFLAAYVKSNENITWESPRQILAGGLTKKTGHVIKSSVSVEPNVNQDFVEVTLTSELHSLFVFRLNATTLSDFLDDTYRRVPAGKESSFQLPRFVAAVMRLEELGGRTIGNSEV